MACGEYGSGRMAEPQAILEAIEVCSAMRYGAVDARRAAARAARCAAAAC